MTKINSVQAYTLIFLFLLGTTIIFGTPKLVPDTWLVEIISIIPGMLLVWLYAKLGAASQGLFQLLTAAWGRLLGKLLVHAYTVYFLYIAARNVRDMLELIKTTLLRATPDVFIALLFVLVVGYAVYGGLQTLSYLSQIIAGFVVFFFIAIGVLLMMSEHMSLERTLPFLSMGFTPILKESLTVSVWFPYGETIVFLVFYSSLSKSAPFRKVIWAAVGSAGFILTMTELLQIWNLGMDLQQNSSFPLLDIARLIHVGDIITRVDAVVAIMIIFSVMMKSAIFICAAAKGASTVFKGKSRSYIFPMSLLVGAASILVSANFAEHNREGLHVVIWTLHIPFQLMIPVVSGILLWIRIKRGGSSHEYLSN